MKINKILSFFVTTMLLLASCDLGIEETDSVILEDAGGDGGFSGVGSIPDAVTSIYNTMKGELSTHENLYAMVEASTDFTLVPTRGTDWGDNGIWRSFHSHAFNASNQFLLNTWNNWNRLIFNSTEILETSGGTNAQYADAHFVRAWALWVVMDNWGIVPFRNPGDAADIDPTVLTRMEAYDLMIEDIDFAIANLDAARNQGNFAGRENRASVEAAKLLKAKFLLNKFIYDGSGTPTNADMQAVIDLVDEIEAAGYALSDGYFEIFTPDIDTETILYTDQDNGNRMWSTLHYRTTASGEGGGGWNGFSALGEFYDLFEGPADNNRAGVGQEERRGFVPHPDDGNIDFDNEGFGYGFIIGQVYDSTGTALNDRAGAPLVFTREFVGHTGNNERNGIRILKYSPRNGGHVAHSVELRFADAYLMRAEAMFRMGNTGPALIAINDLRALRDADPLGSLTEQDIIDERGRELYQEKWRRNDLIRFGQFTKDWQFKDASAIGDPTRNLMPIPNVALLSNPNLEQNDGY